MAKTQSKNKHFVTLNLKMAIVVVIALIMTFIVFEVMEMAEAFVVQKYYLSDETIDRNVSETYSDFTTYINRREVKSTDTEMIQDWLKNHDYTYLVVSDNFSIYFDGGWSMTASGPADAPDITEGQTNIDYNEESARITPSTFQQDVKNRIIAFADGPYYVYINVYREQNFYRLMSMVEVVLCVATMIGILLIYNAWVLRRVSNLSVEVEEVTSGNLTAEIASTANDEVGRLADNVDTMRNYIIQRLQSEKAAWDKNSELITAMSHDIRTPLTSLMGYLDIIESEKYETEEERKRYISACQDKALQLKELSDKLFQYFLVFGSQASEKNQEVYEAEILLPQIISEHSAELINYGFNVDFEYVVPEGKEIQVDISGLRRLFDNLFSNIMKYADKKSPVRISASLDEEADTIIIRLINGVLQESRLVESNKIGLKTCSKICDDMGGTFAFKDEGHIFTIRFTIPAYEEKIHGEEEISEGLAGIDIHSIDIENIAQEVGVAAEVKEVPEGMDTVEALDAEKTDKIIDRGITDDEIKSTSS